MNVNRSCATFHGRTENLSSSPAYAFAMLRARRVSSIWCDCYVQSFFWNSAQFFEGVRMPCHLAFKRVLDCILFNSHRIADAICCQRMALQCLRLCASVHPPTDESMTVTFSVPRFRSSVQNAALYLSDVSPHAKVATEPFAAPQDAPGTVSSSAKRSDSANSSASYPACSAIERPSTSKSAIRVIGLAVVESPKARCSTSNIS